MSAGTYNFTIEQGTYFKRIVTWKNTTTGDPIDITGYTPHMQIRTERGELLEDCDEYLEVTNAAGGQVTIIIPDTANVEFDFDTANYDLFLRGPEPRKLIKGQVTLDPAVTKDDTPDE